MRENEKASNAVTLSKKLLILLICLTVAFSIVLASATGIIGYRLKTDAAPQNINVHTTIDNTAPILNGSEGDIVSVVDAVADTVVEIKVQTTARNDYNQVVLAVSAGSGVIISDNGAIITNNHVIDGAESISVQLRDGTVYSATLIATDAKTDIAIIKIEETMLPFAVFGNSDSLKVGQTVVAIGNPLGTLGGSVTSGIVSALDRDILVEGTKMRLIQTNAAINPGNSGGGLFNLNGELIGVVNAKSTGDDIEGLGFAIPSNIALTIATELMENGYISGRVTLGIDVIYISDPATLFINGLKNAGLYVKTISGSNASSLAVKDLIVSINGTAISNEQNYLNILDSCKIGDDLTFIVVRGSNTLTFTITAQEDIPANALPSSLAA